MIFSTQFQIPQPNTAALLTYSHCFFVSLLIQQHRSFLFGESTRSLKQPDAAGEQTFADAFNLAQEYVAKRFRLLDLYWLIGGRKFQQACERVHNFADQIIDRNLSRERIMDHKRNRYIFLDSLAESTPNKVALRGQIINILAAGRD